MGHGGAMTAGVLTVGLFVAVSAASVLRRLPEPHFTPGPGEEPKTAYRDLRSLPFLLSCSVLAMIASAATLAFVSRPGWPVWLVLSSCGVLLVAIDARTTWLPLSLTRACWFLAVVATALSLALGGDAAYLVRSVGGAAAAGLLYLAIWLVTRGGIGFGDVRFAPVLGAATGGQSWTLLLWALTLGTMVGAVHGLFRLLTDRRGPFPYAPSMLAGTFVALAVLAGTLTG